MLRTDAMADVLDPRFQKIWDDRFTNQPEMISRFYSMKPSRQFSERFSTLGTMSDVTQFTGSVDYDDVFQGYDVAVTPLEWTKGIQIQRRLFDTDQHNLIEGKPKALAGAFFRTRQQHAARPFNNAFGADSFFYNHSEGLSLCSNSHTTTSGASTATGFDNLVTTSLSAVSYSAACFQMKNFRGDRAEKIQVRPSTLLVPTQAIAETAYEIINSQGKVDTANNNANYNYQGATVVEWIELNSSANWFLLDDQIMKDFGLVWLDAVKGEFAMIEDFDSLVGKWRGYAVYGNAWVDWRFALGASVS